MLKNRNTEMGRSRKGTVAVLVAVLLVVLVGMLALVLDGGLLQDNRREVQSAADAAALAAASKLFTNYTLITANDGDDPTNTSKVWDPSGAAATAATSSASTNGFPNNNTTSTVVVNIPPTSGPFANDKGCVEVIVTFNQTRYFSTIWGSSQIPVRARSVARARYGGTGIGIILLDPTADHALDASGGGSSTSESVNVTGGATVYVNSNYSPAARTTGGGSMTAAAFKVVGGYTGTSWTPTPITGTRPVPDPLAYLPVPSIPTNNGTLSLISVTTKTGNQKTTITTTTSTTTGMTSSSSTTTTTLTGSVGTDGTVNTYTLTAGKYGTNGTPLPNFSSGDTINFTQQDSSGNGGIYYIAGGGLTINGSALLQMVPLSPSADPTTTGGIMIYNAPASTSSSQGISIGGSGGSTLTALKQGPYAGILFWQDRNSAVQMSITGSSSDFEGTFYAANANLKITGNGTATIGSQYISRTLGISGNGTININYTDKGTARLREVMLVE